MAWLWLRVLLGNNSPVAEKVAALPGSGTSAARDDHAHPRLSSATGHTVGAGNEATITFTRQFDTAPVIDCMYEESADNPPIVFKVKSWTLSGGKYSGCVIRAYRAQVVPQNLATLLLTSSFNVFGGSSAGIPFTCLAVQRSD